MQGNHDTLVDMVSKGLGTIELKNLVQHIVTDKGVIYEIYVKPWSMIFNEFELRYKYLFDKLNLKRDGLKVAGAKNKEDLKKIVGS